MKIRLIYFVISAISGLLPIIGLFIYLKINDPLVLYEKFDRMVFENESSKLVVSVFEERKSWLSFESRGIVKFQFFSSNKIVCEWSLFADETDQLNFIEADWSENSILNIGFSRQIMPTEPITVSLKDNESGVRALRFFNKESWE